MIASGAIERLAGADRQRFRDWPDHELPRVACGVYAVWEGSALLYVGMSGHGASAEAVARRIERGKPWGLRTRLNSHASGRRSGDQFCVYVADRLVLPAMTRTEIEEVGRGERSLDAMTRAYVRERLSYAYVVTRDGGEALRVEHVGRSDGVGGQLPLLNASTLPGS